MPEIHDNLVNRWIDGLNRNHSGEGVRRCHSCRSQRLACSAFDSGVIGLVGGWTIRNPKRVPNLPHDASARIASATHSAPIMRIAGGTTLNSAVLTE